MPDKKKREKVVAEITVAHLTLLVEEMGSSLSREEAVAFLNRGDRAYDMWKQMMRAGEQYIKSTLELKTTSGVRPNATVAARQSVSGAWS